MCDIKGKREPRVFTPPLRRLTRKTSLGFLFEDFCRDICHTELLPWQRWLGIHGLEVIGSLDGMWSFRFREIVVLVGRQNGKTTFLMNLNLFFMYVLAVPLTVGTAQSLDNAERVWKETVELIEKNPEMAREIDTITRRNGAKGVKLTGGREYIVKAATREAARSLSIDLAILDELREHTTWDAWGAISSTTRARPNAQLWAFSNAGDAKSVVLRRLRLIGHKEAGDPDGLAATLEDYIPGEDVDEASSLGLFEWSAHPECDPGDIEAWAQANPSLGYGFMTERALRAAFKIDPDAVFRTESLCQWVESRAPKPFSDDAWELGLDGKSEIDRGSELYFGLDVSFDRRRTSIAVCGKRSDGEWHVELIAERTGFGWAVDWLRERLPMYSNIQIAVQGRGAPVSSYIGELQQIKGLTIYECVGSDVGAWTGRFYDGVMANVDGGDQSQVPIHHREQPALDKAAEIARKRALGDGAFGWDRNASSGDIAPIVAATMAHGLATHYEEAKGYQSAYDMRNGEVLVF